MTHKITVSGREWVRDALDAQWWICAGIGAVRGPTYRPGGWWFLAEWLPDADEHDTGPFQTRWEAMEAGRTALSLHHGEQTGPAER